MNRAEYRQSLDDLLTAIVRTGRADVFAKSVAHVIALGADDLGSALDGQRCAQQENSRLKVELDAVRSELHNARGLAEEALGGPVEGTLSSCVKRLIEQRDAV